MKIINSIFTSLLISNLLIANAFASADGGSSCPERAYAQGIMHGISDIWIDQVAEHLSGEASGIRSRSYDSSDLEKIERQAEVFGIVTLEGKFADIYKTLALQVSERLERTEGFQEALRLFECESDEHRGWRQEGTVGGEKWEHFRAEGFDGDEDNYVSWSKQGRFIYPEGLSLCSLKGNFITRKSLMNQEILSLGNTLRDNGDLRIAPFMSIVQSFVHGTTSKIIRECIITSPFSEQTYLPRWKRALDGLEEEQSSRKSDHTREPSKVISTTDGEGTRVTLWHNSINRHSRKGDFLIANDYLGDMLNSESREEFLLHAGRLMHLMAIIRPIYLGNSAVMDWIVRGAAKSKEFELGRWNQEEAAWHLKAAVSSDREEYARWFAERALLPVE